MENLDKGLTVPKWVLIVLSKSKKIGLGQINSVAFGVFSVEISAPILVQ